MGLIHIGLSLQRNQSRLDSSRSLYGIGLGRADKFDYVKEVWKYREGEIHESLRLVHTVISQYCDIYEVCVFNFLKQIAGQTSIQKTLEYDVS